MILYINGKPAKNIQLKRSTYKQIVERAARARETARLMDMFNK